MKTELFKVVIGRNVIDNFQNSLSIISPINQKEFGIIPKVSTKEEIDQIFANAKSAFAEYRKTPLDIRKDRLLKFSKLLKDNWDKITNIIVWEIAKSKRLAIEELDRSVKYIEETIEEYEKIINHPFHLDESVHGIKGKEGNFFYEPIGVVLCISPFNYPLNLLISKIAPALISGNVVVFKPATQGSCLGAFISTLLYEAGFVNGEISCVIGKGREIGDYLTTNKNIDMISFTGSTQVGKEIALHNYFIPVVLELGGKDAAIVLEDCNLEKTAKEIVKGSFSFNGQRCTSIKRVLVDEKIKDKLLELINEEVANLNVGSAASGNFDITELIDYNSLKQNLNLILDAVKNGAKAQQKIQQKGIVLYPVVLDRVSLNSKIAWSEQFGPILPIITFSSIEEAIAIHNASEYGLQASIFTENIEYAKKIADFLEVGSVNINRSSSRGPDIFPFGGRKNSAKGTQGIYDSIISMNRIKGIVENN